MKLSEKFRAKAKSAGVQPPAVTSPDPSLLDAAVRARNLAAMEALFSRGLDIEAAEQLDRYTPLMRAVCMDFVEGVELLLAAGANVDAVDAEGKSVIMYAVGAPLTHDHREEIAVKIIRHGANANLDLGRTAPPIIVAMVLDMYDAVKAMVEAGVPVGTKNWQNDTALTMACKRGQVDLVRFLLEKGADANAAAAAGSALVQAVESDYALEIATMLLEHGADINRKNGSGASALMRACALGKEDVVSLLLERGADVSGMHWNGKTAFQLAAQHPKTLRALQQGTSIRKRRTLKARARHLALE